MLSKPKINWRIELRKFVGDICNKLVHVMPNRRYIHSGKYIYGLKGKKEELENVVIAVDTSGSVDDKMLAKFATEIRAIAIEKKIQNIYLIYCENEIPSGGIQHFGPNDRFDIKKIKPVGGGGTAFDPPFYWVNKNLILKSKKLGFMIYFTDAGGVVSPNIAKGYSDRVLWVITDATDAPHIKFGKKLFIDEI